MDDDPTLTQERLAFRHYLRTGLRPESICLKYNPWHDPDDGRFTFAGAGRRYGFNYQSASSPGMRMAYSKPPTNERGKRALDAEFASTTPGQFKRQFDDPKNIVIHTVKSGENLSRLAATRKGLRASDLAWINNIPVNGTLKIGQKLRVPSQVWLDANKAKFWGDVERFRRVEFYLANHKNKLPVPTRPGDTSFRDFDLSNPPSIESQITAETDRFPLNGYHYEADMLRRVRHVHGEISLILHERRSHRAQRNAGVPDRLPGDDGGHYVAPRFGGSRDPINHFPQNSGINRGQYRAIEDGWAKARQEGHRVVIDITPKYRGTSLRPYELRLVWSIDGQEHRKTLENAPKGK